MIWSKNILPATTQRVAAYTDPDINDKIRTYTKDSLASMQDADEEELSRRIQTLNAEWDTERFMEAEAAVCIMGCSLLGISRNKFWSFLTLISGIALLQYALLGWCPAMPVKRKLGLRTAEEINQEKIVLKMLRKDFDHIKTKDAGALLKAAEKQ
ncbi:MAG TPA: DUF2892 domain-containing protein [Bacillota bacterium]|nr:DUF2892 domain-containing protein [Bacillota bacterium]